MVHIKYIEVDVVLGDSKDRVGSGLTDVKL